MGERRKITGIIISVFLVSLVGCDIFGVHRGDNDSDNNSDADIVLGERVMQIHLGDSLKNIWDIYGKPKYVSKDFISGEFRSWYGYTYYEGRVGGLLLFLYSTVPPREYSYETVIDSAIIDYIWIDSGQPLAMPPDSNYQNFRGTTKHGIGIGSSKKEIVNGLGKPDSVSKIEMKYGPPTNVIFYCLEKNGKRNEAEFLLEEDSVFAIGFGHFVPYEDRRGEDCEWLRD